MILVTLVIAALGFFLSFVLMPVGKRRRALSLTFLVLLATASGLIVSVDVHDWAFVPVHERRQYQLATAPKVSHTPTTTVRYALAHTPSKVRTVAASPEVAVTATAPGQQLTVTTTRTRAKNALVKWLFAGSGQTNQVVKRQYQFH